jgi:hypothetical protein
LVALGRGSFTPIVTVAGTGITAVGLHKAAFVAWFAVTAAHVLTRLIPAMAIITEARRRTVAGTSVRTGIVALSLVIGAVAGVAVLDASHAWTRGTFTSADDNG